MQRGSLKKGKKQPCYKVRSLTA
uniref:Uncharacterized protein n=1 Tax=Arundo donax TaxID=35708 RepID=A0A0A8ZWV5_ARUDO